MVDEHDNLGAASDPDDGSLHLVGSHRHALDAKRRVAIPKPFRAQAGGGDDEAWVLCRQLGGDPCLALYPPGRFEAALERLEALRANSVGVGNKAVRAYLRKLRMSAARLVPDRQSRITLSEEQCALAGIDREAVFVGSGDHLELWAPERLEHDEERDFGDLASEIFG